MGVGGEGGGSADPGPASLCLLPIRPRRGAGAATLLYWAHLERVWRPCVRYILFIIYGGAVCVVVLFVTQARQMSRQGWDCRKFSLSERGVVRAGVPKIPQEGVPEAA